MAASTGVEVHLMIPCKPDHPFVYWATFSNAAALLDSGCIFIPIKMALFIQNYV